MGHVPSLKLLPEIGEFVGGRGHVGCFIVTSRYCVGGIEIMGQNGTFFIETGSNKVATNGKWDCWEGRTLLFACSAAPNIKITPWKTESGNFIKFNIKTNRMKKVLIALDYNPTAQKVAETGYSLGKSLNAEIILLHVIADPMFYATSDFSPIMGYNGYVDVSPTVLENIDGLKDASLDYLNKTKQHLGDDSIQTLVNEGDVDETILSTAKNVHADIIVMGTHSQKWLENIVMGSVAESVMKKSTVPILIIPTKKDH